MGCSSRCQAVHRLDKTTWRHFASPTLFRTRSLGYHAVVDLARYGDSPAGPGRVCPVRAGRHDRFRVRERHCLRTDSFPYAIAKPILLVRLESV